MLGLLSLSQSTGVPGAPRNHWLELISKILFSCCFPLCPFPPGCCSRLALLGCRNLVPRFCRPRRCELGNHQELAVHLWLWPLIPLRASCPGSGNGTQNWGTRRNLQMARTSWCPITKSSTWFLRKNSTALRFYQNPPHTSAVPVTQTITPNTWLSFWIHDLTPKHVGPYCFAAAVELANYF